LLVIAHDYIVMLFKPTAVCCCSRLFL